MPYEDISDFDLNHLSIFEESESELHKPGEMRGITVSRYKLSKYLGKSQMLLSLIDGGEKAEVFCRSLMKILTSNVLVENWSLWERLLQICLSCGSLDMYQGAIDRIHDAIETMVLADGCQIKTKIKLSDDELDKVIRNQLNDSLLIAISRTLCTRWGPDVSEWIRSAPSWLSKEEIVRLRGELCVSRMADSHHFILPIDGIINDGNLVLNDSHSVRTMSLADMIGAGYNVDLDIIESYMYRPYLLKMQELCFCMLGNLDVENAVDGSTRSFSDYDKLSQEYLFINYGKSDGEQTCIHGKRIRDMDVIIVGDDENKDFKVGISNVCQPSFSIFDRTVGNEDGRTPDKLEMTKRIFNQAIKDGAEILVMPECYLPPEWLPFCIRTCMKNDMMLITGLEYIKQGDKVYNITATAMPFEDEYGHKDAVVSFHIKKHYAPIEERIFSSAGL